MKQIEFRATEVKALINHALAANDYRSINGSVAKFDCVFALCQCCAIVFIKDTKAWSYS